MIRRLYVEKKPEHALEAQRLAAEIKDFLGVVSIEKVRIFKRYDVEGLDDAVFAKAVSTVFSDPVVDDIHDSLPEASFTLAVEPLPGQFDQRADSAVLCIRLLARVESPVVRTATVYQFIGDLNDADKEKLRRHLINPVETREAKDELPETLAWEVKEPDPIPNVEGFIRATKEELEALRTAKGLAMDLDDLLFCQAYFRSEHRNPTETEIRVIDTYWSDHCRHTTFQTHIDEVTFADPLLASAWQSYLTTREKTHDKKPICLMDLALIAAKFLRQTGKLTREDQSEEINACTVNIDVTVDGKKEPWLLLFKNETHNHPTEIEPFGGASTCIGGAIRDPLSGRSYVYAAMRVTGASDPRKSLEETMEGKLPQRKIVTEAAQGYASYGNQIGLATGMVHELYDPAYAAKRLEIGAVVGAAPKDHVKREVPAPGDLVVLLGGRTGRDGIGGATGSSKAHTLHSVETAGAEVQKGNAPEERKLQRFFRNGEASRLIKRCNDFGAGGVSVSIGELADGIRVNLDRVPKKYEGLNGTELAISESQERMSVVIAPEDKDTFLALADSENLEATVVAVIQEEPRLVMTWRDQTIVNLTREFLNSDGAEKHISIEAEEASWQPKAFDYFMSSENTKVSCRASDVSDPSDAIPCINHQVSQLTNLAASLDMASQHGLGDRFDGTIGAGTILMPYGGKYHQTPIQAMVHQIPLEVGETDTCSVMSWAFSPAVSKKSPFHGAYLSVVHAVAKLLATGASREETYLTLQEYFKRPGNEPRRWSEPLSALLGAFRAQMDLEIGAIGGKDSMSGTFEHLDVPPTLVAFAITTDPSSRIVSPEWKASNHSLFALLPRYEEKGLPNLDSINAVFAKIQSLSEEGVLQSAWALGEHGIAEAILEQSAGNRIGLTLSPDAQRLLFRPAFGGFLIEVKKEEAEPFIAPAVEDVFDVIFVGSTLDAYEIHIERKKTTDNTEIENKRGTERVAYETVNLHELELIRATTLQDVFPTKERGTLPPLSEEAKKAVEIACTAKTNEKMGSTEEMSGAFQYTEKSHEKERKNGSKANTHATPRVVIPVFPGTNCEVDSARYVTAAGLNAQIVIVRNQSNDQIAESVDSMASAIASAQMIFLPGGFSGGDEPDGSAKLINAFFRNPKLADAIHSLLDHRAGLMLGICNGFQALVKLGLLPFGHIVSPEQLSATLTFNAIGRHQSQIVNTRIVTNRSPWLALAEPDDCYGVAISHGEGRLQMPDDTLANLFRGGQVATQYVDSNGVPSMNIAYNPNGSVGAVEGLLSPDGRILGKMGHSERVGKNLYKNVPGVRDLQLFEAAKRYFAQ